MTALVAIDTSIDTVLRDPRVWRGTPVEQTVAFAASGHAALDAILPHHGWTLGTLNEVLFDVDGVGELELVLPTLAALTSQRRHVVVVGAPYLLYPAALLAYAIELDLLHCVATGSDLEALWAAEQCLRSGICAAVLCWPHQASERALRRLQVAAEAGSALGFAFRASRAALNPSPAAVRIQLHAHDGTRLSVLKCRGGRPPAQSMVLRANTERAR
jgi:hypothetical protein